MISQTVNNNNNEIQTLPLSVAYWGTEHSIYILKELPSNYYIHKHSSLDELHDFLDNQSILTLPDIVLMETDPDGEWLKFIERVKKNPLWRDLIVVIIATTTNKDWKSQALRLKVHDYYILPFQIDHLLERLNFLVKFKLIKPRLSVLEDANVSYKLPLGKKVFDILSSSLGILLLFPVFLITAVLIKLDSKGPIIYKSKRVGTGYNIFDFYKFRSMHINAASQLDDFNDLNRYVSGGEDPEAKTAFVKLKDDPRVTRFGEFIRRTSIDELPQLFNVIKGDMSLVGNRPLPLYEAEMLTSNDWSLRFMGPAGVTGLWQIKSRGKREVSERERKKFDNFYASKYSFWFDLKILIKTLPVILHKEKF